MKYSNINGRKGFTLIELLVVIAIIAILAAILFPVFAQAKAAAKKAVCLSGQKQIALGAIMYSNDYDDLMPPINNCVSTSSGVYACQFWWYEVTNNYNTTPISAIYTDAGGLLQPYLKSSQIDGCPAATGQVPAAGPGGPPMGIAENALMPIAPTSSFDAPASTIMLADQGVIYGTTDYARDSFLVDGANFFPAMEGRHNGGTLNVGWCDGHAKSAITSYGDFAAIYSLPASYVAVLQQRHVGWVMPPGVSSVNDPRLNCYYLPIDSYTLYSGTPYALPMTRPATCPE